MPSQPRSGFTAWGMSSHGIQPVQLSALSLTTWGTRPLPWARMGHLLVVCHPIFPWESAYTKFRTLLLIEFESAQKINVIRVAPEKTVDRPDWIAFEDFNRITE